MNPSLFRTLQDMIRILVDRPVTPRIHDEGDTRCLRFNDGVVQSSMRRSDPFALDLSYTRAMTGFQLFVPDPREILVVGLGGGSLPKYCHSRFPLARITTVEIDPTVIALRDEFRIPPDDERFRIVQADAAEYMARDELQADVILLDGYDADGLPESLCSSAFYAQCWNALTDTGVLVANLWGGAPHRALYVDRLRDLFGERVWWSRPHESTSLITFAVKRQPYFPEWSQLQDIARQADARYRIDLLQVVSDLRQRPAIDD